MSLIDIHFPTGNPLTFRTWEQDGTKRAFMVAVENYRDGVDIRHSASEVEPKWFAISIEQLARMVSELDVIEVYCYFDNALATVRRVQQTHAANDRYAQYIPRWESALQFIENYLA